MSFIEQMTRMVEQKLRERGISVPADRTTPSSKGAENDSNRSSDSSLQSPATR